MDSKAAQMRARSTAEAPSEAGAPVAARQEVFAVQAAEAEVFVVQAVEAEVPAVEVEVEGVGSETMAIKLKTATFYESPAGYRYRNMEE